VFKRWPKVHVFCFRNCRKSFNFLSRFSSPFCTTYFSSQKQQQVCPVLMRHQVAGLVADLAENSSVVPALKAWKPDRTMVAVVPLLLGLFCDEEVRLGYDRPESGGAIANLWAPLRRHAEAAIAQEDAASASAAATGGGYGDGNPSSSSNSAGSSGAKKSFARLATALQQSASAQAERALRRAVEAQDLRAKVS
jgi:hypothetical protein